MEWNIAPTTIDYPAALATMAARVAAIQKGEADELVWLVEHPPLYTLGTSAKAADVLVPSPLGGGLGWGHNLAGTLPNSGPLPTSPLGGEECTPLPTYQTGRGGQVTYHGPGQRVVYLMLDLKKRAAAKGAEPDLRAYVKQLEQWIILTLAQFGVEGFTRDGRVGVWVEQPVTRYPLSVTREESGSSDHRIIGSSEKKIAALGVRVQKWVTSHGIAINVNPDLSHYAGIIPCGISEFGVTSMYEMGSIATMAELDVALKENFAKVFGE